MFGNFLYLRYLFRTDGNWRYPGPVRVLPGKDSRRPAGPEPAARHEAALKRLAPLLRDGRELNPRKPKLPETLEETLAGGIVWLLGQRLIGGEAAGLRALLPETLEFVLRPYVGEDEAAREAAGAAEAISA